MGMLAKRYKLAIFDFDGTLADSKEIIGEATNRALADCGYSPLDPEQIYDLIGLPLSLSLGRFLGEKGTEEEVQRVFERYRYHWYELEPGRIHLFPGVRELLEALQQASVQMAVATSKSMKGLDRMFDMLDLRDYFAFAVTNDLVTNGKPHPEMIEQALQHCRVGPQEALMIGDTTYDLQMGRAAGVDTCAVTYGSHSAETLAEESPTFVADSVEELRAVLLGLPSGTPEETEHLFGG